MIKSKSSEVPMRLSCAKYDDATLRHRHATLAPPLLVEIFWDLLTCLVFIVVTWSVCTPRNRVHDMLNNRLAKYK